MKIAYKLLCYRPSTSSGPQLTSCISCLANTMCGIDDYFVYQVGQIMKPPYGKFFVFKEFPTWDQIYKIIGNSAYYRVYKCIVPSLLPAPVMSGVLSSQALQEFWKEQKYKLTPKPDDDNVQSIIPGTFWASEVVLIEDVTSQCNSPTKAVI